MKATLPEGADQGLTMVRAALESALRGPEGQINAATETKVANALHILRSNRCDRDVLEPIEQIAVWIRLMLQAKRDRRPNFYASRLLRLRRMVASPPA